MYRFNHPSAPNTRAEQKPEQSNRSTTLGGKSWKQALALSAVPLAMLFGAAFQSSNSVPAQLQAIQSQLNALQAQVTSLANKGPRKFYVTKTTHSGAQALSACAEGYHMASLREIFDTSNLRYDTELGGTTDDSGFGPPNVFGWVRTGEFGIGNSFIPGLTNCYAWTTSSPLDNGTAVAPFRAWAVSGTTISPWGSLSFTCSTPAPVWCVQD
jgi:hypothetical protein